MESIVCGKLLRMTGLIALIDAEIATLQQARSLIAAATPAIGKRKPGRPAKAPAAPVSKPKQKRKMSPEGRARLVAAVKARWAAQKKAAK
jgi:hypothetical protein